jgi:excisionase family DNA binding protein
LPLDNLEGPEKLALSGDDAKVAIVMFNVMLETDGPEPSESQFDDWMDALAPFHASIGGHPDRDVWSFTLSLPAESLVQALAASIAIAERTTKRPMLSAEVMSSDEFDRRNGFPVMSEQMSVSEIAKHLGVTRQAVLKMIHARKFATVARVGDTWAVNRSEVYARQGALGFSLAEFSVFD